MNRPSAAPVGRSREHAVAPGKNRDTSPSAGWNVVGSVYRVSTGRLRLIFAPCLTASPDRGGVGAQSNVVNGQKLHADTLKDALNGIDGCRIWGCRSSSKSLTALSLTEAAFASLPTD
jgi:hypothetical protein